MAKRKSRFSALTKYAVEQEAKEEIKVEDREKKYSFNVDGKWYDYAVSDRTMVKCLENYNDLLTIAHESLDVISMMEEGKPVPLGYFKQKVLNAIRRAEGK